MKDYDQDSDSTDEIPSYQPPKTHNEQGMQGKWSVAKRKRKAEADITSSTEAKVRKMEESIRKLQIFGQADMSQVTLLQCTGKHPARQTI